MLKAGSSLTLALSLPCIHSIPYGVPKVKGFRDEMLHKDFTIFDSIFVQLANKKEILLAPAQCEQLKKNKSPAFAGVWQESGGGKPPPALSLNSKDIGPDIAFLSDLHCNLVCSARVGVSTIGVMLAINFHHNFKHFVFLSFSFLILLYHRQNNLSRGFLEKVDEDFNLHQPFCQEP